ncbi:MAG TPA: ParB N-terminal domain-containing protein [Chloroflexota bacterium]|nr:ParB N-terminal domain-containing protein [Chloroflexota bacterium]
MARRTAIKRFPFYADAARGALNTLPARPAEIAVARITGSVDKANQLTPTFLPKREKERSARFRSVRKAMQSGIELPPIQVYALGRDYYVIDGHHRVGAAIASGVRYLDAEVLECIVPERSYADQLANARMRFERRTGLTRLACSQIEYYARFLTQILAYRDKLRREDPDVTTREAAQRWYRECFVPIAEPLDLGATTEAFPGRTVSDLYLAVEDHRAYLEAALKAPVSMQEAVADLQKQHPRPLTTRVLRPLHRHARRAVWRVTGGPAL